MLALVSASDAFMLVMLTQDSLKVAGLSADGLPGVLADRYITVISLHIEEHGKSSIIQRDWFCKCGA